MELVKDMTRCQNLVQSPRACFESVVVLVATVKVDLQAGEVRRARQDDRTVLLPISGIRRITECAEGAGPLRARHVHEHIRESVDKRRALRAHRRKKIRVAKGQMQRSVTAHRHSRDGPVCSSRSCSVPFFDEREKFQHEKILVPVLAVLGIDVKASAPVRRSDQKVL